MKNRDPPRDWPRVDDVVREVSESLAFTTRKEDQCIT